MNYEHHYNTLCERATERELEGYTESHHVIPRCLGGSDDPENLVNLTPEEHYVAHQLLVKMYPDHQGLIWAAIKMTGHSKNDQRSNNKMYGWLRRKHQKVAKARTGKKNGSYGRSWYHKPRTLDNIKCLPEEVPEGYVKGRKLKEEEPKPNSSCTICGEDTGLKHALYCIEHRNFKRKEFPRIYGPYLGKDGFTRYIFQLKENERQTVTSNQICLLDGTWNT